MMKKKQSMLIIVIFMSYYIRNCDVATGCVGISIAALSYKYYVCCATFTHKSICFKLRLFQQESSKN